MDDIDNRKKALHRIGNILVPSKNYTLLEGFLNEAFEEEWQAQQKGRRPCTPSQLIDQLGARINHPDSVYYWCHKHGIPVFSPALTDGAIGDMLFSFGFKREGFILDIAEDIRAINKLAMFAPATAALVLGGGLVKHHIFNANIWRNGAEFAVLINTGLYEDGSDSGAKLSEAFTWGKLKPKSRHVKVFAEASLVFPTLVC
jgi:deoxyhypusine synthase